jgi:drug/metabolite transporter (DMT)-like permease
MPTDMFWRIAFVIIGVTVLPYLLMVVAMKTISPSIASSYIYLQPILSGFFVYLFYLLGKEDYTSDFSFWKIPCALLVFFGVYLISKKSKAD